MPSITDQKSILRVQSLARRDGLPMDERIVGSLATRDQALQLIDQMEHEEAFLPGMVVSGFMPIRSEIDPRPVMDLFRERGARLCVPVVVSKTEIEFRELVRGAVLVDAGFGSVGPDETASVLAPQLMLMPLSAYDLDGGRIGYGGGFYDRAIERLHNKDIQPKRIGMAFSVQCAETKIPMEAHDQRLHALINENEVVKFS